MIVIIIVILFLCNKFKIFNFSKYYNEYLYKILLTLQKKRFSNPNFLFNLKL